MKRFMKEGAVIVFLMWIGISLSVFAFNFQSMAAHPWKATMLFLGLLLFLESTVVCASVFVQFCCWVLDKLEEKGWME